MSEQLPSAESSALRALLHERLAGTQGVHELTRLEALHDEIAEAADEYLDLVASWSAGGIVSSTDLEAAARRLSAALA